MTFPSKLLVTLPQEEFMEVETQYSTVIAGVKLDMEVLTIVEGRGHVTCYVNTKNGWVNYNDERSEQKYPPNKIVVNSLCIGIRAERLAGSESIVIQKKEYQILVLKTLGYPLVIDNQEWPLVYLISSIGDIEKIGKGRYLVLSSSRHNNCIQANIGLKINHEVFKFYSKYNS